MGRDRSCNHAVDPCTRPYGCYALDGRTAIQPGTASQALCHSLSTELTSLCSINCLMNGESCAGRTCCLRRRGLRFGLLCRSRTLRAWQTASLDGDRLWADGPGLITSLSLARMFMSRYASHCCLLHSGSITALQHCCLHSDKFS